MDAESLADHRVVSSLDLVFVHGSAHSNWALILVELEDGATGIGEATVDGGDAFLVAAANEARDHIVGHPVSGVRDVAWDAPFYPAPLAMSAVASAVDQCLWDIQAKRFGAPIWDLLGGVAGGIPFYGNLNRSLTDGRSPSDFASTASEAEAAGVPAMKIAPFDGVMRGDYEDLDTSHSISRGLERVAAVRRVVPAPFPLMIDCHWRFASRTAVRVLHELEVFEPFWVEAPVSENDAEAWGRVRGRTDLRLAGGEMLRSPREFKRFIDASGVDVVLPDVKYCGGITGLQRVAALAAACGVRVAPHNPSGPVASLATAHSCLSMPGFLILEWPWGESKNRGSLAQGAERFEDGQLHLPARPGLGLDIDLGFLSQYSSFSTTATVDSALFGPDRPTRNLRGSVGR